MFMRKCLVTYATLIGLFSSMYSLVISKKNFPCKILLTLTAVIWILPSVYSLVYVQRDAVSVKRFVTLATLIFLPSSVYYLVTSKSTSFGNHVTIATFDNCVENNCLT
ncbi:unnamed protein product [Meganyctiphanes norvegica]|uniref:Uncharacterized protein n=1 Tax=Meganyctiphanes norvegica TaxID=48144 RepID=A0AAV2RHA0_MEGNR